ncbi:Uncharacterised protein [Mycobacteroides abscessus subsp. abscessus]|nr:Uncharacterised protein [Mycobacteroides abscessus subsp. abscessus]
MRGLLGAHPVAQRLGALVSDDGESAVDDHVEVGFGVLSLAREVVAEEEGVRDVEGERLEGAQVHLPTAGDAQLAVGAHQSHGAEDAEAVLRGELVGAGQRRAFEGDEEVDGDRIGVEVAQGEDRLDDLLIRLPHPDDESRARGESGRARLLHGVDAVGEGVGRADLRVVRLGGVEVVVVGVDPGGAQALGLTVLEEAEARTDLDVGVVRLDVLGHRRDTVDVPVRGAAAAGDEADAGGASGQPELRLPAGFVARQPRVLEDLGVRAQTLRAVAAVLGAEPRLEVDEVVDLDRSAEEVPSDPTGGGDEVEEFVVGGAEDRQSFLGGRRVTGTGAFGQSRHHRHAQIIEQCSGKVNSPFAPPMPLPRPGPTTRAPDRIRQESRSPR